MRHPLVYPLVWIGMEILSGLLTGVITRVCGEYQGTDEAELVLMPLKGTSFAKYAFQYDP